MSFYKFIFLTTFLIFSINMSSQSNDNSFKLYDLSKSKMTWLTQNDSYGVWKIESICYLYQRDTLIDKLLAIGPMMAAKSYAKSNLFYNPEFIYRAVFGNDSVKFFRTHYPYKFNDTQEKISDKFKGLKYYLKGLSTKEVTQLDISKIKKLVLSNNKSILCEINFNYKSLKIRIICNVKNINFNKNSNDFQVESGEVVFPYIFNDSINELLGKSTFSYLAFNNLSKVDFILEILNKKTGYKQFEKRFTTNAEIKLWSIN